MSSVGNVWPDIRGFSVLCSSKYAWISRNSFSELGMNFIPFPYGRALGAVPILFLIALKCTVQLGRLSTVITGTLLLGGGGEGRGGRVMRFI